MLEWIGASITCRRLHADLVHGQQMAPGAQKLVIWRTSTVLGTRGFVVFLRSCLEFIASRPPRFIVDCHNVYRALKDMLVWLFEVAHRRTVYFAIYTCICYCYYYYYFVHCVYVVCVESCRCLAWATRLTKISILWASLWTIDLRSSVPSGFSILVWVMMTPSK